MCICSWISNAHVSPGPVDTIKNACPNFAERAQFLQTTLKAPGLIVLANKVRVAGGKLAIVSTKAPNWLAAWLMSPLGEHCTATVHLLGLVLPLHHTLLLALALHHRASSHVRRQCLQMQTTIVLHVFLQLEVVAKCTRLLHCSWVAPAFKVVLFQFVEKPLVTRVEMMVRAAKLSDAVATPLAQQNTPANCDLLKPLLHSLGCAKLR
jgi:hypothetical protein